MDLFQSLYNKEDPRKRVKGCTPKIKNIAVLHFRGILGTVVPIVILALLFEKDKNSSKVSCLWLIMFWTLLIQPIAVPATGFLPLFMLPMSGAAPTVEVASHYFSDSVCLFILGGMLHLLINTSGFDRRIIMWLLCSGDSCHFSGKILVFKASTAAFFLSIFSNRLIITSTITQFLTTGYMNLQKSTSRYRKTEPDYDEMRCIVLMAVQSASSIGSVTILHAALTPLAMKAMWTTNLGPYKENADIFNYMQYTCFAFPVAFFMFVINVFYHMLLLNIIMSRSMSMKSRSELRTFLLKQKESIPPFRFFELETVFFYVLFLVACFYRWSEWITGWAAFRTSITGIVMIKDATVAAIFLIGLSILPRKLTIWKYIAKKKKSELGTLKPESAILWWRFADKNTIYGYIILIGGALALNAAIKSSQLDPILVERYGKYITNLDWNASMLIICLLSVILANIMTGIAGCCIFLPFILNVSLKSSVTEDDTDWTKPVVKITTTEVLLKHSFLGALAIGIGTSLGFTSPFLYTPAYFCHYTGKVPLKRMIPYGIGSAIICLIILWLSLCFYGPVIWSGDIKTFEVTQKS